VGARRVATRTLPRFHRQGARSRRSWAHLGCLLLPSLGWSWQPGMALKQSPQHRQRVQALLAGGGHVAAKCQERVGAWQRAPAAGNLCCSLTMRTSRSAWLLSNGTRSRPGTAAPRPDACRAAAAGWPPDSGARGRGGAGPLMVAGWPRAHWSAAAGSGPKAARAAHRRPVRRRHCGPGRLGSWRRPAARPRRPPSPGRAHR